MAEPTMAWVKSTFCSDAACLEVAFIDTEVAVRDGKDQTRPPLRFTNDEWHLFLDQIIEGSLPIAE
jgi:hypothetical protein